MTARTTHAVGFVVRTAARRDRRLVAVMSVVVVALVYASAALTPDLYATTADRVAAAEAIDRSGAVVALYGPIIDPSSVGELAMTKLTVLYTLAVAALALVLVRRHTRAEEEDGRTELLAATGIGRDALLLGAVAWGSAAAVLAGVLAAAADVAGGLPVEGSAAFGASWAGIGLVAAALTAVAAQLARTARATAGLVLAALGVTYAVRAVADVAGGGWSWLGWVSPFGWTTRLNAWSQPRWWVIGLWVTLWAVGVAAALVLSRRRDLGAGLIGESPGPARGGLGGAASLALALHRGTFAVWAVACLVGGAVTGALAPGVGDLLDNAAGRELLRRLGGPGALEDALLGAVFAIAGIAVAGWGIAVIAHAEADEQRGRTELLLATPVRSIGAATVTAALALGPPLVLLGLVGAGAAAVLTVEQGDVLRQIERTVPTALAAWPAAAVVVAVALLAWGLAGRGALVGWSALGLALLLDEIGPLLHLPGVVLDLSPFRHVPVGVGATGDLATPAQALMVLLSAVITVVAVRRFARRDLV